MGLDRAIWRERGVSPRGIRERWSVVHVVQDREASAEERWGEAPDVSASLMCQPESTLAHLEGGFQTADDFANGHSIATDGNGFVAVQPSLNLLLG